FAADPEKYLAPKVETAPAPAQPGVEYTCPMHPEVVQPTPGSCPICGMALEPKTISLEEPPNPELVDMQRRFWASAALTAPLLAMGMADMAPAMAERLRALPHLAWIQLALATPVVLWGGLPFFERGWVSVRTRRLNMFTLIA